MILQLSERYGKVFSFYFGGRPAVIITGMEAMREALVTKAVDFAGRPDGLLLSHLTQGQGTTTECHYQDLWKFMAGRHTEKLDLKMCLHYSAHLKAACCLQ